MKQKRHASNIIYRDVADAVGLETLRREQELLTGNQVTTQTAQRYYNGYGRDPIPAPAFQAARRLNIASYLIISSMKKATTKKSKR